MKKIIFENAYGTAEIKHYKYDNKTAVHIKSILDNKFVMLLDRYLLQYDNVIFRIDNAPEYVAQYYSFAFSYDQYICNNIRYDINSDDMHFQQLVPELYDCYVDMYNVIFANTDQMHIITRQYCTQQLTDSNNNMGIVYYYGNMVGLYETCQNYIDSFGILPQYQHKGLAKLANMLLINNMHYDTIITHISSRNISSKALYRSLNFVKTNTSNNFYVRKTT